MNKYKKLINNSIIFTIGNFGSKLISFFMVPLYTSYLTTSEYGTADLMTTTKNLLLPFLTLEIGQAALRFAIETDQEEEKETILSNIIAFEVVIAFVITIALLILKILNYLELNSVFFILLLIFSIFNNTLSQYMRGVGLVKQFAVNGILMTIVTVISNIILLVYFQTGIYGYLLSMIIALIASNLYICYSISKKVRLWNFHPQLDNLVKMLRFSIPIVPTSSMWWIINSSTRYFILFFLDASANGLFAVANKIPSVVSMIISLFSQSWQLSSFEEFESEDKDTFYSNIFNTYSSSLFIISSIIIMFLKPVYAIFINSSFYEGWKVTPFLIFAVIYQGFSSFLGTNYTASKQTKGAFTTSIHGGIISIITSLIFLPLFGIIGAGISSFLSFFGMFMIRIFDTKKYVKLKINLRNFIFNNIMFILQTITLFIFEDLVLFIIQGIMWVVLLAGNKDVLALIWKQLLTILKRK